MCETVVWVDDCASVVRINFYIAIIQSDSITLVFLPPRVRFKSGLNKKEKLKTSHQFVAQHEPPGSSLFCATELVLQVGCSACYNMDLLVPVATI